MTLNLDKLGARLRAALPELAGAYLFGSESAGAARADSDVDIAIVARRPIAPRRLATARQDVSDAIDRNVDLVDLNAASTILQMEVLRAGRPLGVVNAALLYAFELRVFRDYFDLKLRRADIVRDIQLRGRVYA